MRIAQCCRDCTVQYSTARTPAQQPAPPARCRRAMECPAGRALPRGTATCLQNIAQQGGARWRRINGMTRSPAPQHTPLRSRTTAQPRALSKRPRHPMTCRQRCILGLGAPFAPARGRAMLAGPGARRRARGARARTRRRYDARGRCWRYESVFFGDSKMRPKETRPPGARGPRQAWAWCSLGAGRAAGAGGGVV